MLDPFDNNIDSKNIYHKDIDAAYHQKDKLFMHIKKLRDRIKYEKENRDDNLAEFLGSSGILGGKFLSPTDDLGEEKVLMAHQLGGNDMIGVGNEENPNSLLPKKLEHNSLSQHSLPSQRQQPLATSDDRKVLFQKRNARYSERIAHYQKRLAKYEHEYRQLVNFLQAQAATERRKEDNKSNPRIPHGAADNSVKGIRSSGQAVANMTSSELSSSDTGARLSMNPTSLKDLKKSNTSPPSLNMLHYAPFAANIEEEEYVRPSFGQGGHRKLSRDGLTMIMDHTNMISNQPTSIIHDDSNEPHLTTHSNDPSSSCGDTNIGHARIGHSFDEGLMDICKRGEEDRNTPSPNTTSIQENNHQLAPGHHSLLLRNASPLNKSSSNASATSTPSTKSSSMSPVTKSYFIINPPTALTTLDDLSKETVPMMSQHHHLTHAVSTGLPSTLTKLPPTTAATSKTRKFLSLNRDVNPATALKEFKNEPATNTVIGLSTGVSGSTQHVSGLQNMLDKGINHMRCRKRDLMANLMKKFGSLDHLHHAAVSTNTTTTGRSSTALPPLQSSTHGANPTVTNNVIQNAQTFSNQQDTKIKPPDSDQKESFTHTTANNTQSDPSALPPLDSTKASILIDPLDQDPKHTRNSSNGLTMLKMPSQSKLHPENLSHLLDPAVQSTQTSASNPLLPQSTFYVPSIMANVNFIGTPDDSNFLMAKNDNILASHHQYYYNTRHHTTDPFILQSETVPRAHSPVGTTLSEGNSRPSPKKLAMDEASARISSATNSSLATVGQDALSHYTGQTSDPNKNAGENLDLNNTTVNLRSFLPLSHNNKFDLLWSELGRIVQQQNLDRRNIESLRIKNQQDFASFNEAISDIRTKSDQLNEQITDNMELQQTENENLRLEIKGLEEKISYQVDDRTQDIIEMMENIQTRISKIELAQQRQQLVTLEGLEMSAARNLLLKSINILIAFLQLILLFTSTIAQILSPFVQTRSRTLVTLVFSVALAVLLKTNPNILKQILHVLHKHIMESKKS